MQPLPRLILAAALAGAVLAGCGTDPDAEYTRGMELLQSVRPDPVAAAKHLRGAADAGSAGAAFRLALLLRRGADGVARDPAQAFARMRQAALVGVPQAEFLLGQMLLAGEGTRADAAQAHRWFEQAAEHDLAEAHLELALAGQRGEWGIGPAEAERHLMEAEHALRHRRVEP